MFNFFFLFFSISPYAVHLYYWHFTIVNVAEGKLIRFRLAVTTALVGMANLFPGGVEKPPKSENNFNPNVSRGRVY